MELSWQHSVTFVRGLMEVATAIDVSCKGVFDRVRRDLDAYAYPMLALHAADRRVLGKYAAELRALGLGKSYLFWLYHAALYAFRGPACDHVIKQLLLLLGRTPSLGETETGVSCK